MKSREELFRELLEANNDRIGRICKVYAGQSADDLYQEIAIAVWQSMQRFREDSSWHTYIYRIALNTALTFSKKQKRQKGNATPLPDEIAEDTSERAEKLETERQMQQLYRAIRQLPDEDKALIALYLEDMSYNDIADITGISVNHVGVKIHRLKNRLSQMIRIDNDE